jgi:hypothetical protein
MKPTLCEAPINSRSMLGFLTGLFLFSLFLVGGCTGSRGGVKPVVSDYDPLLRRLEAGYASTRDLTVEGNLKISGVPATVWFDAYVKSRDSMKIILTGPFSIPVGAMSATSSSFVFFNPDAGEALDGRPDRETFQKLMLVALDYNEMISLLRGEIPHIPAASEYTAAAEDGDIRFVIDSLGLREEFVVDPDLPAITSYRRSRVRPDTTLVELDITYQNFTTVGDRRFPRNVVVDVADGTQRIRVTVEKVTPEIDAEQSLMITIPGGIPRRRI